MHSNSESGLNKNVTNLQLLIEHLHTFGAQYNPSNAAISIAALQTKQAEAESTMASHRVVENAYNNATDARELEFDKLLPLSTRIINALEASGASPLTVNNARTILRRIRGVRKPAKKKKGAAAPEPVAEGQVADVAVDEAVTHSVSHRSHDQVTENFAKFLQVIQDEPLYQPGEADITVTALQAYLAQLNSGNGSVSGQVAGYTASLNARNAVLYDPGTGIPDLAKIVKAYVKSVFGADSVQYKAVSRIPFRNR